MIASHKLHRFVVNPQIPLKYNSKLDRLNDIIYDAYDKWLVQWLIQDQMLFTWLLSTLSDSVLPRVLGCKHSFQVWDKIHEHFHSYLKAKVRQFRSELKGIKKGNRSISDYVLRIKALADSLLAIGDPISEQDHIDIILDGLPEEYNSFVKMVYGRPGVMTISDIEALLLVQEAQLDKFRQELAISNASVNVAQSSQVQEPHFSNSSSHNGYQNLDFQNNNFRGRGCGRGNGGNRPTCQLCHKYGQDAFNC